MRIIGRFFCVALCLLTVLSCTVAFAADTAEYHLSDLGMTVEYPVGMSVRTRDTDSSLSEGIYLEAESADGSLAVRIAMLSDKNTEQVFNLGLLSDSALAEYKEQILSNDEYSDCTEGRYGDVLFLDFSTHSTSGSTEIFGRQSVTVVNGMSITVSSQSVGDTFTSDEMSLIKNSLSSIRFDRILSNVPGVSFWTVLIWIVVILIILVAAFFVLSYFMGKKNERERAIRRQDRQRNADYDVLSAAAHREKKSSGGRVTGYKTSADYFGEQFDSHIEPYSSTDGADRTAETYAQDTAATRIKEGSREALTHTGYFFKNLSRMLHSGKAKKTPKKPGRKQKKPSKDYDVFGDK